ncbi:MAG: FHA domain-containing protein, partial [Myxococcota bacterium]
HAVPVAQAAPLAQAAAHAPAAQPQAGAHPSQARLVSIRKDGSDGQSYALSSGEHTDIGRTEGDIVLAEDPYLSPRHARISVANGRYVLRDLSSLNGVYVRLAEAQELRTGDFILIGQQVLRFELLDDGELSLGPARLGGVLAFGTPEVPRYARLHQYTTEGVGRDIHYLYRDETVLGRETGDIVFTDDPFLSRRHASIVIDRSAQRATIRDLGSANGTSIRLRGERVVNAGQQFRIGRHLFRFDLGSAR